MRYRGRELAADCCAVIQQGEPFRDAVLLEQLEQLRSVRLYGPDLPQPPACRPPPFSGPA